MSEQIYESERVLEDDYPVYPGYLYVCDGVPQESPVEGTVRELKHALKVGEVRRCDIVRRMQEASQ